jgi:hypothetical protein
LVNVVSSRYLDLMTSVKLRAMLFFISGRREAAVDEVGALPV